MVASASLDFDGSDDYVSVADNNILDVTNLTISAWVKTTDALATILDHYAASPFVGYGFGIGPGVGAGQLAFWSSGEGAWVGSTSTVNDGTWKHVAIAYSSDTQEAKFYINGVL